VQGDVLSPFRGSCKCGVALRVSSKETLLYRTTGSLHDSATQMKKKMHRNNLVAPISARKLLCAGAKPSKKPVRWDPYGDPTPTDRHLEVKGYYAI